MIYKCEKCKCEIGKTTWVHYNSLCGSCYWKWVESLPLIERIMFLNQEVLK